MGLAGPTAGWVDRKNAPISADLRAMERLDGRYYLLALCADDYVAEFPKQMERGLPR
jgi:hypothetical protein